MLLSNSYSKTVVSVAARKYFTTISTFVAVIECACGGFLMWALIAVSTVNVKFVISNLRICLIRGSS
jgi:hypothetical protein